MFPNKFYLLILFNIITIAVFSQEDYSIRDLKQGKFKENSSYVYTLPFQKKNKVFLIQAYDSKMSHKNELALDFKVKQGTRFVLQEMEL